MTVRLDQFHAHALERLRLALQFATDVLQERFGTDGMLMVICSPSHFLFDFSPELSALRAARLHRIQATLGGLSR
jgi:hypothetical protein